jgi:hypothetical protein
MRRSAFLIVTVLSPHLAFAQIATGPAPDGEATVVAQNVIRDNFEKKDCALVVRAARLGDGSILAECSNNERFRVFSVKTVGNVAMRCSALRKLGMAGC